MDQDSLTHIQGAQEDRGTKGPRRILSTQEGSGGGQEEPGGAARRSSQRDPGEPKGPRGTLGKALLKLV